MGQYNAQGILYVCYFLNMLPHSVKSWIILSTVHARQHIKIQIQIQNVIKLHIIYVVRPQSKFPTRPTASKPYIARSDCAYVIEPCCSMAHALTILPAFSQ
jgi:hypothetical protein